MLTARLAREALETDRVKLEVVADDRRLLQPAVLGSARMPSRASRSSTPGPPPASRRRMATVVSAVPDATSARSSTDPARVPRTGPFKELVEARGAA